MAEKTSEEKGLTWPEKFEGVDVDEQETIILWMRGDEEAKVYTSDSTVLTKLKKVAAAEGGAWRLERVDERDGVAKSVTAVAPLRCISLRAGAKKDLSDEERAALSERMKRITVEREAKKREEEDNGEDN